MEQTNEKKPFNGPRGEHLGRLILEELRAKALRHSTLFTKDEHWAWRPTGHLAKVFGPAGMHRRSLWRWFADVYERLMGPLPGHQRREWAR